MSTFANVYLGASPNDQTGTELRNAFQIVNQNFANIANGTANVIVNAPVRSVAGRTGNIELTVNDVYGAASVAYINNAVSAGNAYVDSVAANIGSTNVAVINANVTTLQSQVNGISSNVTVLQGNVISLTNSVVGLTGNSATQEGEISLLVANSASQATLINNLNNNVAGMVATQAALVANAEAQAGQINTLTANAVSQQSAISVLQSTVLTHTSNISTLTSNAGSQATQIAILNANAITQATEIINLTNSYTVLASTQNAWIANAALQETKITELWANAAVQAGNITALTANALVQQVAINVLANTFATLQSNDAVQATAISNLNNDVVGVINNQSALFANAGVQANQIISTNAAMKSYVDNQVSNIVKVGNVEVDDQTMRALNNGNPLIIDFTSTQVLHEIIVDGTILANANVVSTTTNTGALQVVGGAGISGNLYVGSDANTRFQVGTGGQLLPNVLGQFTSNVNAYAQVNMQNLRNGPLSSSDFVATANDGNDANFFIDMGIASSTYSYPEYPGYKPHDGYVLVNQGNLLLNTDTAGKAIRFLVGGTSDSNEKIKVTESNVVITANIVPGANVTYSLGNQQAQWKELWVSGNTIYIGNVALSTGPNGLTFGAGFDLGSANASSITTDIISGNVVNVGTAGFSKGDDDYIIYEGLVPSGIRPSNPDMYNLGNVGYAWNEVHANVVYATTFNGDGSQLTGLNITSIINGTSDVAIPLDSGNIEMHANTANWVFDTVGNLTLPQTDLNASPAPTSWPGIIFSDNTFQNTAYTGNVSYTMGNSQNWNTAPVTVVAALDELAQRLKDAGF